MGRKRFVIPMTRFRFEKIKEDGEVIDRITTATLEELKKCIDELEKIYDERYK